MPVNPVPNAALQCDKCGHQTMAAARYHQTCNVHIVSEPTHYCQGVYRPIGQFNTAGAWQDPGSGHKDKEHNQ